MHLRSSFTLCISRMQHHTAHDKIDGGNWKSDCVGNNLQQRVHCLVVGCCQIAPASNHCTLFCHMSRHIRKPTICICENKGADQLCSNCTADQRFCFRNTDSTVPLLLISKEYRPVCIGPGRKLKLFVFS